MKKKYFLKNLAFVAGLFLLLIAASCKKDNSTVTKTQNTISGATPTKLGLYEADSGEYKQLIIGIEKVGTQTVKDYEVFDTGSGGMVIDADGILPASMITNNGFVFAGDSTVVNGVTVTKYTLTLTYGANDSTLNRVHGNLAYAPVTIGDANGTVVIKRLPFFIYYEAVSGKGKKLPPHDFDTFGVSSEYIVFSDNKHISSPFSYFDPGTGLVKGFKLAALGTSNFSIGGTYVPGLVTLGLTSADLSSSSGFVLNQLLFYPDAGYLPTLPSTVTYNGSSFNTDVLFDTGTGGYNYIEDPKISVFETLVPSGSPLSIVTNSGFTWDYTTAKSEYLTYLESPSLSGAQFSVLSIESFITNEYLLDYTDNKLGLKNN
jgi:hypothetical protein